MTDKNKKVSKKEALKSMEGIFKALKKAFGEEKARKIMKLKPQQEKKQ